MLGMSSLLPRCRLEYCWPVILCFYLEFGSVIQRENQVVNDSLVARSHVFSNIKVQYTRAELYTYQTLSLT
jgi:hypothetical protein